MAYLIRDFKLEEALEVITNLDDSKENELIKYYIQKKDDHINVLHNLLKDYQEVFDKIDKFLPNKG